MPPEHFQVTDTAGIDGSTQHKKLWVNLKPDIDLGHAIAMLTFLGGLFMQYNSFDKRVTVLEQQMQQTAAQSQELKSDVKDIKKTVGEINTQLAVQNYITKAK